MGRPENGAGGISLLGEGVQPLLGAAEQNALLIVERLQGTLKNTTGLISVWPTAEWQQLVFFKEE